MSEYDKTLPLSKDNQIPWHKEPLPEPASKKRKAKEYIEVSGKASAQDLWATLHSLLEYDSGKTRISRSEIAKCMGVSDKLVHRWLAGPSNMSIETAGKIVAAMKADLNISAIPWEDNDTQLHTHSYAPSRCVGVSAKYIVAKAKGSGVEFEPQPMVRVIMHLGNDEHRVADHWYTESRSITPKIEVKQDE